MSKLPNQSNILFFTISVVLLYAVYYLFVEPKIKSSTTYVAKQSPELAAFMSEIMANLNKKTKAVTDSYIIKRVEDVWVNDPFYDINLYGELAVFTADEQHLLRKIDFKYTGYLQLGEKEIAIINEIDYEAGETLDVELGLYDLESVKEDKILIENKAEGRDIEIQLPDLSDEEK